MSKVPLDEQIAAVQSAKEELSHSMGTEAFAALDAALRTLKLFRRFEMPVRACLENCLAEMRELEADPAVKNILEHFPDASVVDL